MALLKHCIAAAIAAAILVSGCERLSSDAPDRSSIPRTLRASGTPPLEAEAPSGAPEMSRSLPTPDAVSDTAISTRITASLAADPDMSGADVSVNADHGVVHLAGLVKSQEQVALASAHAQRQDGVMRIDSHLTVAPQ